MAAAPRFKIYKEDGEYIAACKRPEEAAAVVGLQGEGATIRDGHHRVVWTEGDDGLATESYDTTALIIWERVNG